MTKEDIFTTQHSQSPDKDSHLSKTVVADLFYLPPLEFFVAVQDAGEICIERHDNYQKQNYRNRTTVQLANQVKHLSIPVVGGNKKLRYIDLLIDDSQNWRKIHLRGIQSAYGKAPFFDYFYPDLEKILLRQTRFLYDLNFHLLTLCLNNLRHPAKLSETSGYHPNRQERDIRGLIQAKAPFEQRNIYKPYPYTQIFGLNFAPNLSVIDLLFCEGPNANRIIFHSKKKK